MDRETVITHLQIIHTWAGFAREHDLQFFTAKHLEDIAQWSADALELLKEHDDLGTELTNAMELIHKKNERVEKLLKEQGCAKIKEPDCRICGQSHCKYYHKSRKPTECKSYIRMEGC